MNISLSLYYRGPPYLEGTPATTPWGPGVGSSLTGYQWDYNVYSLASAIIEVAAAVTAGIDYFYVFNGLIYVVLTDHTTLEVGALPTVEWNAKGAWLPNTAYNVNDEFYYNGAAYVVLQPYPGAATFNANAVNGSAQRYFSPPIIEVPPTDITYEESSPLENGQVLTWSSVLGAYTNENPTQPAPVTVTLTASQIANAHGTPIQILPAPGVGFANQVISAYYSFDFNTTAFSSSGATAGLFYGANGSFPADNGDADLPSEGASSVYTSYGSTGPFTSSGVANKAVDYYNSGTNYHGGNGTMKITVVYEIVPV